MLTEFAPDPVVIVDDSGRIIEWNPRAEETFGWSRQEAIGSLVSELIVPSRFRPSHEKWMKRFAAGEEVEERRRLLGLRRDGTEIPVEATLWTITAPGSSRRICSAFLRDLSSVERAAGVQAQLAALVDSSEDAIIGLDLGAVIETWNHGAERLYGYTAAEAIGRNISFMIPPERAGDADLIIERLGRGESLDPIDTVRITKTGELVDVAMSVSPIVDELGVPVGASSIARDITQRKDLEAEAHRLREDLERRVQSRTAELEEANRKLERLVASKTDFVASVSHELRTPLTSVIGFAELLMDSSTEFDREQRHDLLGAIADQGYELANIVEDLLVAARSEMGDLHVSQVSVNLKAQTAQVLESMRNEEASAITISGDPQFAIADPQRVRQILRNLLTNAIRYGGSDIGVRVDEPEDGMVAVVVSDDGDGISDEARERIFERYEQEGDDTGVSDSFGLGLSISRALARLMGGELVCQRTAVTEFVLSLPIDASRYEV
jgi:PAS domain S-box-containing protein